MSTQTMRYVVEDFTECEPDYDNDGNPVWVGTPVVWTFESKDALIEHLLDVVHDGTGVKLEYRTTADGSVFARYSV